MVFGPRGYCGIRRRGIREVGSSGIQILGEPESWVLRCSGIRVLQLCKYQRIKVFGCSGRGVFVWGLRVLGPQGLRVLEHSGLRASWT